MLFPLILPTTVRAESKAAKRRPVIELTHWWKSQGEQAALNEIKRGIEAQGGEFIDKPMADYDVLRRSIIERLSIGYPPAMTQWLAGGEARQLHELNAIVPTPATWRNIPLKAILFPEILEDISFNGKPMVLPVGIHIQNAAFFSARIYNELHLSPPTTWKAFLQQAVKIKQAGYTPIALSDEPWQLRFIFNAILMEVLGAERFNDFYNESKSVVATEELLTEAISLFLRLKPFAGSGYEGRVWSEASQLVVADKAAMQIMGDFAKGELTAAGKIPDKDFFCMLAPGANQVMLFATDSFVMLQQHDPDLLAGQQLAFDVVLDPTIQAAFNSKKGGIPVRTGVDPQLLDECARPYYQAWMDRTTKSLRLPDVMSRLRLTFVQKALHQAWKKSDPVPADIARNLITTIEQVTY